MTNFSIKAKNIVTSLENLDYHAVEPSFYSQGVNYINFEDKEGKYAIHLEFGEKSDVFGEVKDDE